jgi:hypothetical protein
MQLTGVSVSLLTFARMKRIALWLLLVPGILSWFCEITATAASYYTARPDDPAAVCLTPSDFPQLHADGVGDDTASLEAAIAKVTHTALGKGVVLIPSGRYRLSHTVQVPPGVRLFGFGTNRPVFVLGPDTPGYQDGCRYMIWFTGRNGEDANPGTFYSALANIDFEIGPGNPGAVGIRAYYAQHCYLAHIDFHTGSGLAGIGQADNEAEDLHFYGGDYGIVTMRPSPSWQFTLLDSTFEGQRVAAIQCQEAGLTLIRDRFRAVPTAISIDQNHCEQLWMKDCRLEEIPGPALVISNEKNIGTEINLENVVCKGVFDLALYRDSGRKITKDRDYYLVNTLAHGVCLSTINSPYSRFGENTLSVTGFGPTELEESDSALPDVPLPVPSDIPPLPPVETWASIKSFGATGDGKTDDLPAFQAAIAKAKVIFLPAGRYRVSDSIRLKPDTILVGLSPITTQIAIDDNAPGFAGDGDYKGVVESSTGGVNILQGIGVDSGANNPRAVGVKWMAGEHSMVNDVKFLGGHGSLHPPYNRDHTGDSNPARHWDSSGPGLLVTQNGGGTFADIWTASTFDRCGVRIENTTTSGRIYELSSEHHVRNEVMFTNVSNWNIYALQTEEEWGESSACRALDIQRCANLTFANLFMFRVHGSYVPANIAANVSGSDGIRFRNVHVYSQSKFSFDTPVYDADNDRSVRYREFAVLDVLKNSPKTPAYTSRVFEGKVKIITGGFSGIDNLTADSAGNLYFLDNHAQQIFRWSTKQGVLTPISGRGLAPAALTMDKSGDLLIVSRNGTVYALASGSNQPVVLKSAPAQARPGLQAIFPANRWYDWHTFIADNLRKNSNNFVSPDGTVFIPVPDDFLANDGQPAGIPPIDLLRTYQLTAGDPQHPVYIADEYMHETWKFDVMADGSLTNAQLFAEEGEAGAVQDAHGNIYVAAGNIFLYDHSGNEIDMIEVPERPTSLAFGGADGRTLYIAARTSLYSVRVRSEPLPAPTNLFQSFFSK